VCLTVERGEVVLLVGDNGAGKSTLLNAATGRWPVAAGQVRLGDEARLHFLPQDAAHALRGDQTAWEWMEAEAAGSTDEARRRTMRKMGIPSEAQAKPLSALSGGERTRLCIARMLLSRANLLVLDEPTNHLDLLARQYLEEAIRAFDGAVLVVSHDRQFAAQISTRVVELVGGQLREAGGDYRSYVRARGELQERLRAREIEGDERAVTAPSAPVGKREARRRRARSAAAP
jgi:ATP-binding cassette subfamily F protein 3